MGELCNTERVQTFLKNHINQPAMHYAFVVLCCTTSLHTIFWSSLVFVNNKLISIRVQARNSITLVFICRHSNAFHINYCLQRCLNFIFTPCLYSFFFFFLAVICYFGNVFKSNNSHASNKK